MSSVALHGRTTGAAGAGDRRKGAALLGGVAVLAFVLRLTPMLLGGGLRGIGTYDDAVYYAAGDALASGRLPYRDFTLLHPPGIALVLAPFGLLGQLTSDATGLAVARLAFMAVGALNAVLVARTAGRWGPAAGLVGGVTYACSFAAIYGERSTLVEPLGSTALLVALLLLLRVDRAPTARAELLAGVALGLGACFKIWSVVPWGVVVLWQLLDRDRRSAARVVAGGVVASLFVLVPFLLASPGAMVRMVVQDQLGRPVTTGRLTRLPDVLGARQVVPERYAAVVQLVTVLAAVLLLAAAVLCWRHRRARVLPALLAAHVAVLLAGPSYFQHYSIFVAAPEALVLGVAAGLVRGSSPTGQDAPAGRPGRAPARVLVALVVLAALVAGVRAAAIPQGRRFPAQALAAALPPQGCVASDEPVTLILMDVLSRDLERGCRVEVDVTGVTYDVLARTHPDGTPVSRRGNRAWQQHLVAYLTQADAMIYIRASGDSLTPQSRATLDAQPVLKRVGRFVLHGRAAPGPR